MRERERELRRDRQGKEKFVCVLLCIVCVRERERELGDSFYEEVRGLMCSVYVRGVMCYYEPAFFGLAVEEGIQISLLFCFCELGTCAVQTLSLSVLCIVLCFRDAFYDPNFFGLSKTSTSLNSIEFFYSFFYYFFYFFKLRMQITPLSFTEIYFSHLIESSKFQIYSIQVFSSNFVIKTKLSLEKYFSYMK